MCTLLFSGSDPLVFIGKAGLPSSWTTRAHPRSCRPCSQLVVCRKPVLRWFLDGFPRQACRTQDLKHPNRGGTFAWLWNFHGMCADILASRFCPNPYRLHTMSLVATAHCRCTAPPRLCSQHLLLHLCKSERELSAVHTIPKLRSGTKDFDSKLSSRQNL